MTEELSTEARDIAGSPYMLPEHGSVVERLAAALEAVTAERDTAIREMHARELHHFEEEQLRAEAEAERDRLKAALNEIQAYADRKGTCGFSELHNLLSAALNEGKN